MASTSRDGGFGFRGLHAQSPHIGTADFHPSSDSQFANVMGQLSKRSDTSVRIGVHDLMTNSSSSGITILTTTPRVTEWLNEHSAASRVLLEVILKAREQEFLPQSSPDGTAAQRVAHRILNRRDLPSERNLPRNVMADMLGMRPETLSRALHSLADLGLIEVGRRHVLIVDVEGLQKTLPI